MWHVAKDHKKCMCGLKKTKGPYLWSLTYIHTCIHMYVSKVNLYPLYLGQLWTHWFNRLSQHVHMHTWVNKSFFIDLAIAVFSTYTHTHIKWTLYFNYFIMFVSMIIKLLVSQYLLLSHFICLCAGKICVVFVETKSESNSCKLWKVLSPPHHLTVCKQMIDSK